MIPKIPGMARSQKSDHDASIKEVRLASAHSAAKSSALLQSPALGAVDKALDCLRLLGQELELCKPKAGKCHAFPRGLE